MTLQMERVTAYASYMLSHTLMTLEFLMFKFLHYLPIVRDYTTVRWFDWTARIVMKKHEYWNSAFTWSMYKAQSQVVKIGTLKCARYGRPAPNPPLLYLDGYSQMKLLDFTKGTRPLVVNFGSNSWPPFIEKISEFGEIQKEFAEIADFLVVYIQEMHPEEGWPISVSTSLLLLWIVWKRFDSKHI